MKEMSYSEEVMDESIETGKPYVPPRASEAPIQAIPMTELEGLNYHRRSQTLPQIIGSKTDIRVANQQVGTRREFLQAVGVVTTGAVAAGVTAAHIGLFDRIKNFFVHKPQPIQPPKSVPISEASPKDFEQRVAGMNTSPGLTQSISEQLRPAAYNSPDNKNQ